MAESDGPAWGCTVGVDGVVCADVLAIDGMDVDVDEVEADADEVDADVDEVDADVEEEGSDGDPTGVVAGADVLLPPLDAFAGWTPDELMPADVVDAVAEDALARSSGACSADFSVSACDEVEAWSRPLTALR